MRYFIAVALAAALIAPGAHAQQSAVASVIQDQIAAFKVDDFVEAFDYASPGIKRMFGSPERFGRMVRSGYPMVHRPAQVTMLEQRDSGQGVVQRVMIRDETGQLHMLDYRMIRSDGGWQINGVQIVDTPEVGA